MDEIESRIANIVNVRNIILTLHYWGWHPDLIAQALNQDGSYVRLVILEKGSIPPYLPHD